MATLVAPVKWAQRRDNIFLTIDLRDIANEKVEWVSPSEMKFSCTSDKKDYATDLNLFGEINIEESKWNVNGREMQFILVKKEEGPYWKRLLKEDKKYQHITVDWSKYVDEDEEAEEGDKGLGQDWNPENMKGFGGGGPEEEEDSDDDEDHSGHDHDKKLDDLEGEEEIPTKTNEGEDGDKKDNVEEETKA